MIFVSFSIEKQLYRSADKSLAPPGKEKLRRQKILVLIYPIYSHNWRYISTIYTYTGVDKSLARPGRKNLRRQKILIFIYPIYNHNLRNISTVYIYITRLASNEIF